MNARSPGLARSSLAVLVLGGCSTIMGYEERSLELSPPTAGATSLSTTPGSSAASNSLGGAGGAVGHTTGAAGRGLATSSAQTVAGTASFGVGEAAAASPSASLGGTPTGGIGAGGVAMGGMVAKGGSIASGTAPVTAASAGAATLAPGTGGAATVVNTSGGAASIPSRTGGAAPVVNTSGGTATSGDCSATNVFCDGFEEDTSAGLEEVLKRADAGKFWSENGLVNIRIGEWGTFELAAGVGSDPATGAKSGKGLAIHFDYTGNLAESGGVARLGRKLGISTTGSVQIDFDFQYSGEDAFYPFSLLCGKDYELSFNLDTNIFKEHRGSIQDGTSIPHEPTIKIDYRTPNTEFQQWRHIRLSLNRGTRMFAAQLDGVSILEPTRLEGDLAGDDCSFAIALLYVANATGSFKFDAYFDNVRIEVN